MIINMQQPLQKDCSNILRHQDPLHTSDVCSQNSDLRSAVQAWPRVLATQCLLLCLFLESGSGAQAPGPRRPPDPFATGGAARLLRAPCAWCSAPSWACLAGQPCGAPGACRGRPARTRPCPSAAPPRRWATRSAAPTTARHTRTGSTPLPRSLGGLLRSKHTREQSHRRTLDKRVRLQARAVGYVL